MDEMDSKKHTITRIDDVDSKGSTLAGSHLNYIYPLLIHALGV